MGDVMHRVVLLVVLSLGVSAGAQVPSAGLGGVVTDEQGQALAGVSIEVQLGKDHEGVPPSLTSEDGRFAILGLDGGRDLVLDLKAADGRRRLVFGIDAPSSGLLDLGPIVLPQPARLEGRVIVPDGSALLEAEVSLYTVGVLLERVDGQLQVLEGQALGRCRIDPDGRFALGALPPGWATVATLTAGHAPDVRTVLLSAGSVTHVDVQPGVGSSIRGRVVAPDSSQPISGQVTASRSRSSYPSGDAIQRDRATLDVDGAWQLADLPAGRWFVEPRATGYDGKPVTLDLPTVVDGAVDLPLVADAPESGSIEATVVDDQGQPLEAFTLWCASFWGAKSAPGGPSIPWGEWMPFAFGPDASGLARLGPLETGEYQLIATTDGRVSNTVKVSVRSDSEPVEARLSVEPAESLRVEVVDERTGSPLPGATLLVDLHSSSQPLEHRVETDAFGAAVIGRLPRGPVDLRIIGGSSDTGEKTSVTLPHADVVRLVGKAFRILHVRLSRSWRAAGASGEWFDRSFVLLVRDAKGDLVGLVPNVVEGAALTLPPGDYHVDVAAFDPGALFTTDSQGHPQLGRLLRVEGSILAAADVTVGDGPVTVIDF